MRAWLVVIGVAGCFRPTPPEGAACARGTDCPAPLVCDRGICVGTPTDADVVDLLETPPPDTTPTCVARWRAGTITTALAPMTGLNSTANDVNPFVTADGGTLYFASNRGSGLDLYRATRTGSTFANVAVAADLSSTSDDGAVWISADGLRAVVSSSRPGLTAAGRNLWQATRATTADPFGGFDAAPFANVNTDGNEYELWLSPDLRRLYQTTSANMEQAIALATRQDASGVFSTPAPIPELTSAGTECCHALSADELVIVFASDRSGTRQVYYATRAVRTAPFDPPKPVPGLATMTAVDLHMALSADACTLYVASTRSGGLGAHDLWVTGIGD